MQRFGLGLAVALLIAGFGANQAIADPLGDSHAADVERDACNRGFHALRQEAEERGKLVKAAAARHVSAGEACTLIGNYVQAELEMVRYVDANAAKCGLPTELVDRFRAGEKTSETIKDRVCAVAGQR